MKTYQIDIIIVLFLAMMSNIPVFCQNETSGYFSTDTTTVHQNDSIIADLNDHVTSEKDTTTVHQNDSITRLGPILPKPMPSIIPASIAISANSSVLLTCEGLWPGTMQWQINNNGSGWTNISGATGTTYNTGTLANTGTTAIIVKYKVLFTYNGVTDPSSEAVVTVLPAGFAAGNITPAPMTIVSGENVDLTHTGSALVTSRQWQMSTDNGSTWTNISGATGTTYNTGTLTNSGSSNITRRYRVKLNGWDVYSSVSIITITPAPTIKGSITPAAITVNVGDSVNLTASGSLLRYTLQWQMYNDNGQWFPALEGGNSLTYNTGPLTNEGTTNKIYKYRVKIVELTNTYSAESVITVNPLIPGSISPSYQTVPSGTSATLTHTGYSGVASRKWQEKIGGVWTDIAGATDETYITENLEASEDMDIEKTYRVKLNGQNIYSLEATVSLLPIGKQVAPSSNRNYIHTIIPQIETTSIPLGKRLRSRYAETIEYFDGLGRPLQTVALSASNDEMDIVTPFEYDNIGREAKKYLPYKANTDDGSYHTNALTIAQPLFYHSFPAPNEEGWSEVDFEPSPLNRVRKEIGAGKDWHGSGNWKTSGKYKAYDYRANTSNEVRLWTAGTNQLSSTGYYSAEKLYVTETTDEDGRKVTEYVDLQERTVRQQQMINTTEDAITDYVFDDFGQLRYVLPPAIAKTSNKTINESDPEFTQFVYAYKHDARGRIVEKHIPGAGWTYIVYNKLDQPTLTQDADQQTRNEWSFTKYDALGRVAVTGLYTNASDRETVQNLADGTSAQWETRPQNSEWSAIAFPNSNTGTTTIHTANYYDNYDFPYSESYTGDMDSRVHGLLTGSKVLVLDSNPEKWLYTTVYYDAKGRIVHSIADHLNGQDRVTNTYDFTGKLLTSERDHNGEFILTTANDYDHAGRLLTVAENIGNGDVTVAANQYNALGQLIETTLHEGLETTGYEYNIRGWLTAINGEMFSQKLHYNIGVAGLDNTPQWAGNISAMEWQTPSVNTDWHAYWFTYDNLSRLTKANDKHKGAFDAAYSSSSTTSKKNAYMLYMGYKSDMMGNLGWMTRVHNYDCWDDLIFTYEGNRLTRLREYATDAPDMGFKDNLKNSSSIYYSYDDTGRMTGDANMNHAITYNHLGLTKTVTQNSSTLTYTYDGTGRRLKKELTNQTPRFYMDGIEHCGDTTIIHTGYGRLRRNSPSDPWTRDYFLKDYAQNIRVVLEAGEDGASSSRGSSSATYLATMEENRAADEDPYFANLNETRADRPFNYPDANPANVKVSKVPGKSEGLRITLKVMAGDTIEISAKAFYNIDNTYPGASVDVAPILGAALAGMTNPAGGALGESSSQLSNNLGSAGSRSSALSNLPEKNDQENLVQPKSGINFVLYNNVFDVVDETTGYLPVDDRINAIQNLATDRLVMKEAGFIEIFADNQSQSPVYYDNMMVTHRSGSSNVLEVNAYYPLYGMMIPGLSLLAPPDKKNYYKHTAKEIQNELSLKWYDHGARMLDYTFSRWITPDPLAEKYYHISPYAAMANNPKYIDPNGMWIDDYLLKKNGEIVLLEPKPQDDFDKLIAEDGSSITVSKNKNGESVLSSLADKSKTFEQQQHLKPQGVMVKGNYAITKSGSEAKKVFEFAAKNSTAEWGVNNYKNGDWVVGTLREGSQAPNFVNLNSYYSKENTLYNAHSHGGSSYEIDFWPSYPWDITAAATIKQHNPNAVIKLFMPQNPTRKWMDLPGPYDYKRGIYIYMIRSEGEQYLKSRGR